MPTILLIDDDISLLGMLADSLTQAGFTILRASTVDNGYQLLESGTRPDLIVLEVVMEHGAGWDLLHDAARAGMKVLVLTTRAREEEVVQALEAGATDVLGKPYRTQELLTRIRVRLGLATSAPPSLPPTPPSVPRRPSPVDPTVFINPAAERALVQDNRTAPTIDLEELEHLPLGQRLRAARAARRQTLVQANLETPSNLAIWYLQAMEEEKFGLLPRGPLAERMVREYAQYLGLNADRASSEFRQLHDLSPFKPLPSLGGRPEPWSLPPWLGYVAGVVVALALIATILRYSPTTRNNLGILRSNVRQALSKPTATPRPTATSLPATTTPTPPPPTITPTAAPTGTTPAAPTAASTITPLPLFIPPPSPGATTASGLAKHP